MKTSINLKPTLAFLGDLERNNNKAWFDKNRARYEEARGRYEDFIQALIVEIGAFENLTGVTPKDCIFRINRDIRFSKDKSPYKTHMAAAIAPGGRKSSHLGYYLHVGPRNQSMLGGGVHMPEPDQLAKWREAVDRDAARLKKILGNKDFIRYYGALEGERLKTAPKGFPPEHPEIGLLRLKQFAAMHALTDKVVLSPDVVTNAVKAFKALKPFLDYLNSIL
ncbi:MAG: DUF2461 domain-containing protein [Chloroflexi bacterium]|nr:DUF2461 domain-containing protein [Chloroflexota bacterium]